MLNIIREYNDRLKKYDVPIDNYEVYLWHQLYSKYQRMKFWKTNDNIQLFIGCDFLQGNIYQDNQVGRLQKLSKDLFPNGNHSDIYYSLELIN